MRTHGSTALEIDKRQHFACYNKRFLLTEIELLSNLWKPMVLIESKKAEREVNLVNIDSRQSQPLTTEKKSIYSRSVSMPIRLSEKKEGHVTTSNTYIHNFIVMCRHAKEYGEICSNQSEYCLAAQYLI